MVSQEPVIGIDLGTKNSCVGLYIPETDSVEILNNDQGSTTTPSWVAYEQGDQPGAPKIIVGERALMRRNWIFDAKRMVGKSFLDEDVQQFRRKWPFEVRAGVPRNNCEITLKDSDQVFKVEEVSAHVLGYLKQVAETRCGRDVKKAVITVPAYFNNSQKEATEQAARIAGLEVMRLINEPTAAAMAAGLHKTDEMENVLVFDFGGGTFDISILCVSEGVLDVQATRGDMNLGGRDIDECLVEHCIEEFRDTTGIDLSEDKDARRRLQVECERAKITLSEQFDAEVRVASIAQDQDLCVNIARDKLEEVAQPVLDKLEEPVERALDEASMGKDEIDKVLLVGGSTRIPKVKAWLIEYFDDEEDKINEDVNPDEAVANGAAIMAGILGGQSAPENAPVVSDVVPQSIGIELAGDKVSKLIKAHSTIPCEKTQTYVTSQDNQQAVLVRLRQGEDDVASRNHALGDYVVDGIPPAPKGKQKVEVNLKVNENGILKVTTKRIHDGKTEDHEIIPVRQGGLTGDMIAEAQQRTEHLAANITGVAEQVDQ